MVMMPVPMLMLMPMPTPMPLQLIAVREDKALDFSVDGKKNWWQSVSGMIGAQADRIR
jgi:hypothetical protein